MIYIHINNTYIYIYRERERDFIHRYINDVHLIYIYIYMCVCVRERESVCVCARTLAPLCVCVCVKYYCKCFVIFDLPHPKYKRSVLAVKLMWILIVDIKFSVLIWTIKIRIYLINNISCQPLRFCQQDFLFILWEAMAVKICCFHICDFFYFFLFPLKGQIQTRSSTSTPSSKFSNNWKYFFYFIYCVFFFRFFSFLKAFFFGIYVCLYFKMFDI